MQWFTVSNCRLIVIMLKAIWGFIKLFRFSLAHIYKHFKYIRASEPQRLIWKQQQLPLTGCSIYNPRAHAKPILQNVRVNNKELISNSVFFLEDESRAELVK